jgi:hypothetical protein
MSPGRAAEVPLGGPLAALLLPDPRHTLLLRAALGAPESAGGALQSWAAGARSPTHELGARGRLVAPLIAHNLSGTGPASAEGLRTYLRTALVHEQLRATAIQAICRQALEELGAAGVVALVLRGVAASETVYPRPGLRHCHDLDLFVAPDAIDTAGAALAAAGFRPMPTLSTTDEALSFAHESGMPVVLHTELFLAPRYRRRPETLVTRLRRASLLGQAAHLLDPTDQVVHLLIHAASARSRATLLWACDVWLTVRSAADLDWARLVDEIATRRAALPAMILLTYLARALDAPIPEEALTALGDRARGATRLDKEVALWGAWAGRDAPFSRALRSAAGASERALLLRWRLAPGPDALVLAGRVAPGQGPLRFYLGRPWRIIARGRGRIAGRGSANGRQPQTSRPRGA